MENKKKGKVIKKGITLTATLDLVVKPFKDGNDQGVQVSCYCQGQFYSSVGKTEDEALQMLVRSLQATQFNMTIEVTK